MKARVLSAWFVVVSAACGGRSLIGDSDAFDAAPPSNSGNPPPAHADASTDASIADVGASDGALHDSAILPTTDAERLDAARETGVACPITAPNARIVQMSAGSGSTCVVLSDGTVKCWGTGPFSEDASTPRTIPAQVPCLADITQVSVGNGYICAVRRDGTLLCWGANREGQVGIGHTSGVPAPMVVVGVRNVVEVAAGMQHTCARRGDGTVACWGSGTNGSTGAPWNGLTVPPDVPGLTNVEQIVAGSQHTCARLAGGAITCWGSNSQAERGDAPPHVHGYSRSTTEGVTGAIELAAHGGAHTCARVSSGNTFCWGLAYNGQLGDGTTPYTKSPTPVIGGEDIVQIAAGASFTCGVFRDEGVRCWGIGDYGNLGDGYRSHASPAIVPGLTNAVFVATGFRHACALRSDGSVWCWGDNGAGQLGDGSRLSRFAAAQVSF